jgi:hypothetical protein
VSDQGEKEFIFVDESGDPGPDGNATYILIALHTNETTLDRIRKHIVAFRYHHEVTKEFKGQRWADKLPPGGTAEHLLAFMAELTAPATWSQRGSGSTSPRTRQEEDRISGALLGSRGASVITSSAACSNATWRGDAGRKRSISSSIAGR